MTHSTMAYRSTQTTTYILAATTLVVLGVGIAFNVYIKTLLSQLDELKQIVAENEDTTNIVALKRDVQKTEAGIELLNSYFINQQMSIPFIEKLEDLGQARGVTVAIQDIEVTEPEGKAGLGTLTLTMNAQAAWVPLMQYILLLQNMPYNMHIDDIRIASAGNDQVTGQRWSVLLHITATTK